MMTARHPFSRMFRLSTALLLTLSVGVLAALAQDKGVAAMVKEIKAGQPIDGFVEAIKICGEVLVNHFPPDAINKDESPDKFIVM